MLNDEEMEIKLQEAGINYQLYRNDKDFEYIYKFIAKLSKSISFKYKVNYQEDLTQDAALRVVRYIDTFNKDKGLFYTWLYTMILNTYNRYLQIEKRYSRGTMVEDIDYPEGRTKKVQFEEPDYEFFESDSLTGNDIIEALNTFDLGNRNYTNKNSSISQEKAAAIFRNYFLQEKTQQEIANDFNVPLGMVKNIVIRSRKNFVEYMKIKYPNKKFPEYKRMQ